MKFCFRIGKGFKFSISTHGRKSLIFKNRHPKWHGRLQAWLWLRGLSVHNFIRGECTQDFSCCSWEDKEFAGFFEQLVAHAQKVEETGESSVFYVNKK